MHSTTTYKWDATDYARNASAQYRWASELIEKLHLTGKEQLLDIGCGDGRISAELAVQTHAGSVLGIDASAQMIKIAKNNYPANLHPNLSFEHMDARAIQHSRRFDVAFSNAALHWVDDHEGFLRGLYEVLNPNARLLLQMGGHGNAAAFFEILHEVMASKMWCSYFEGFRLPYHFYDISDYARWLPQNGFKARRIELIPKKMRHNNSDGLKGWFRTTWFPYTDRLPPELRERFINEVIGGYLTHNPPDTDGATTVDMVRLEIEAVRLPEST